MGLLVSIGMFSVTFASLVGFTHTQLLGAAGVAQEASGEVSAELLAATILGSPGIGWYTGGCEDKESLVPEALQGFGLAAEPCATPAANVVLNLSYHKLRNLRSANVLADDSDGAVDYADARRMLGIPDGRDFNIHVRPRALEAGPSTEPGNADSLLRVLYIGHYVTGQNGDPIPASDVVRAEARYLEGLVRDFDPYVYDAAYDSAEVPYAEGGDVVPDLVEALNDVLPRFLQDVSGVATLEHYNVLVAGSNMDHSLAITNDAKTALRDWVRAGGLLIVLGTDPQEVRWLDQLFHPSISSASGSMQVMPPGRALGLSKKVAWNKVDDQGYAWGVRVDEEENFTTLVQRGGASITLSKDDAYGKGRVVLSAFRPFSPAGAGPQGDCDPSALSAQCLGLAVLQVFLGFAYENLQVDYGPGVPLDRFVTSATRAALAFDPNLVAHVEVVATVYYF